MCAMAASGESITIPSRTISSAPVVAPRAVPSP
ncbi:MAG: hypothetical protein BWY76_03117 [bacterium ADurb.Bin429]|nr:MAG: hypothetical protein BWY76_03117 [bacterium ADurb.Bin429]